jgi:hypothetical protein
MYESEVKTKSVGPPPAVINVPLKFDIRPISVKGIVISDAPNFNTPLPVKRGMDVIVVSVITAASSTFIVNAEPLPTGIKESPNVKVVPAPKVLIVISPTAASVLAVNAFSLKPPEVRSSMTNAPLADLISDVTTSTTPSAPYNVNLPELATVSWVYVFPAKFGTLEAAIVTTAATGKVTSEPTHAVADVGRYVCLSVNTKADVPSYVAVPSVTSVHCPAALSCVVNEKLDIKAQIFRTLKDCFIINTM